ncbi:unnamed protein product [Caretta caretta]
MQYAVALLHPDAGGGSQSKPGDIEGPNSPSLSHRCSQSSLCKGSTQECQTSAAISVREPAGSDSGSEQASFSGTSEVGGFRQLLPVIRCWSLAAVGG